MSGYRLPDWAASATANRAGSVPVVRAPRGRRTPPWGRFVLVGFGLGAVVGIGLHLTSNGSDPAPIPTRTYQVTPAPGVGVPAPTPTDSAPAAGAAVTNSPVAPTTGDPLASYAASVAASLASRAVGAR